MIGLTSLSPTAADRGLVQRMLDDCTAKVPGIAHMFAVTGDGLLLATTAGVPADSADKLAAVVSGLTSLGVGVDKELQGEGLLSILVEMANGYLLTMQVPGGTQVAALTATKADLGQVSFELQRLVDQVGQSALQVGTRHD